MLSWLAHGQLNIKMIKCGIAMSLVKETPVTLFLLLHRACCYDYFPYSNSCTLLYTLKTQIHINTYNT